MNREFKDALEDSPVIAAIKDDNGLKECLKSDIQVVFILYGDICNIADIVDTVKQAGKMALVHLDLINGLSAKDVAVEFLLKKYTKADGIISTKPALIKHAGEIGLTSVLRLFVIDSMAYENIQKHVKGARPDVIEVLPALMPKVVEKSLSNFADSGYCRRACVGQGRCDVSFAGRRCQCVVDK